MDLREQSKADQCEALSCAGRQSRCLRRNGQARTEGIYQAGAGVVLAVIIAADENRTDDEAAQVFDRSYCEREQERGSVRLTRGYRGIMIAKRLG